MRQGSNPKRMRGRNGRKGGNPRTQNFESNGPEVKVRGNAQQVVEKYLALARDANSAGDRIAAEGFFQHAEHYYRIMTANSGEQDQRDNRPRPTPAVGDAPQPEIDHSAVASQMQPDAGAPVPEQHTAPPSQTPPSSETSSSGDTPPRDEGEAAQA